MVPTRYSVQSHAPAAIQSSATETVTKSAAPSNRLSPSYFMGVRHATASEVRAALPEAVGKPALVAFSSRMCHDCKRLKPVVSRLLARFPSVHFRGVDVLEDRDRADAVLKTFQPVTVPVLVFIDTKGEIQNVLYNYQSPDTLHAALARLRSGAESAATHPTVNTHPLALTKTVGQH